MGIFQRLFGKTNDKTDEEIPKSTFENRENSDWELLPGYVLADPNDVTLVSLIASSIASGDKPDSEFNIKKIWQRNPEVVMVSLIATSIASIERPNSQLVVKSIYRKKN